MKSFPNIQISNSTHFWKEHPALLYALSLLIGTSYPLFFSLPILAILWFFYLLTFKLYPSIFLLFAAIGYGFLNQLPDTAKEQEIKAIFSPSKLQPHQTPFQKELLYQGFLQTKFGTFPCSIHYRKNLSDHPPASQSYLMQGTLLRNDTNSFTFKPKEWIPLKNTWSLAELRYQMKEKFKDLLKKHLPSRKAATFLASLTTGDVDDRMLRYEFSRVGLQHILAISGFHFGILIAFCSYALQLFLSKSQKIVTLLLTVTLYYIFVGSSPAIERSWIAAFTYLISQWINRPTSGLNLLGVALGFEIIKDPWVSSNIGFQLSFLSCFGLILFYSLFEKKLQNLFPKRSFKELLSLPRLQQHGYFFSAFFRKAISLTLAVNIALFPLILFHFQTFPLLGFLYNLFIPFFITISISLLLIALIFHLLFPPIAHCFYAITNFLTQEILEIIAYPPLAIDFSIGTSLISRPIVIGYLFVLTLFYFRFKDPSKNLGSFG